MARSGAWLVALVAAAACAAAPGPRPPKARALARGKERASWDEVNLLAHAVLQLGHGLKEHVERTGGQVRELRARLGAHDDALARLEGAAEEEEEAKKPGSPDGPSPGAAPRDLAALQDLLALQNAKIEELFQKTKQQQYRMDKQNLQIKSLQSKVNTILPLHAGGNEMEKNPRQKPDVWRGPDPAANRSQDVAATIPESPRQSSWLIAMRIAKIRIWIRHNNKKKSFIALFQFPSGCHQIHHEGLQSEGVFKIQPPGSQPFEVLCDPTPGGRGWTVIQKRRDGSADFDQFWEAYKNGFGNLTGDFWLGLEKTHRIVAGRRFHLLIELEDWEGNGQAVQFLFSLGGEETAYTLTLLGPVLGELENAMGDFPQLPFSTRDRDHDLKGDTNCAKQLSGGWWFSTCGHVNLNGRYFRSIPRQRHERKQGIFWKTWRGRYYPLRATAMKIRPAEPGQES